MRVWADLTNTAHVLVLRPLVELLEDRGHEVTLTARPLSHTIELLDDWGHSYTPLGHHGGASRLSKARAAAGRVPAMVRFGRGRGLDCAFAHGSTDLPVACRLLRIPNTTMLD
jgi:predicted glycosyltransferase